MLNIVWYSNFINTQYIDSKTIMRLWKHSLSSYKKRLGYTILLVLARVSVHLAGCESCTWCRNRRRAGRWQRPIRAQCRELCILRSLNPNGRLLFSLQYYSLPQDMSQCLIFWRKTIAGMFAHNVGTKGWWGRIHSCNTCNCKHLINNLMLCFELWFATCDIVHWSDFLCTWFRVSAANIWRITLYSPALHAVNEFHQICMPGAWQRNQPTMHNCWLLKFILIILF